MEKNMKSANTSTIIDAHRCGHRTPSGRRCKLPIEGPGKPLCFTHTQELMKSDALNLKNALLTNHEGFQTAQGINFSLGNLYKLLAAGYISPRRASVLAFINSLQLRTLPAIDADQEAGITDPTEEPELETTPAAAPPVPNTTSDGRVEACPAPESTWDASIPEPDTTKKPS
jgi:hypothetical protein